MKDKLVNYLYLSGQLIIWGMHISPPTFKTLPVSFLFSFNRLEKMDYHINSILGKRIDCYNYAEFKIFGNAV